jgi:hypothetical protein
MTTDFSYHWAYWIRRAGFSFVTFKYVFGFVAAWGGLYLRRWHKKRNEETAQSWPMVEGRIAGAKVEAIAQTSRYLARVQYTYFIDEYRLGEYTHEFSKRPEADDFVRQLKDKRVQVRYNQSNPAKSVLEQSVIEQLVLLAPRFG